MLADGQAVIGLSARVDLRTALSVPLSLCAKLFLAHRTRANLPPDQVMSGEHKMQPDQTLAQKARESVEWRG
jgi:hypothetical protein